MRLSEAIRLGATMKPQGFQELISADGKRTCAMGAAHDCMGDLIFAPSHGIYVLAIKRIQWPILLKVKAVCPQCPLTQPPRLMESMIVHLNDGHRWTRERIADFVELEEARFPSEAPEEIPDPIPSPSEAPLEVR